MAIDRRQFLRLCAGTGAMSLVGVRAAAETPSSKAPIIDVHLHAYPADMALPDARYSVTGKPHGLKDGAAHMRACLAEMKRLNVVKGIVSGGLGDRLAAAEQWRDAAPDRIIAAAGVRGSDDVPLPELGLLRKAFSEGRLRVLGEVSAQYAGLSLGDQKYEPYLSLAEELDIPVALHTGMGPAGISYDPCCHGFRASLGNPGLVEEALNRHPKMRLNVMHGGWPYLQDMIAVLHTYPQVNLDLGWIDWGLPRPAFHQYLHSLMRAGLGKRIMFGTDQIFWPQAIGRAIEGVDSAPFLTHPEKRDIFYGNAVRFFRLDQGSGHKTT